VPARLRGPSALLDAGLHAIRGDHRSHRTPSDAGPVLAHPAAEHATVAPELRIPFELGGVRLAQAQAGLRELHIHIAMGEADGALAFYDPAGALVLEGGSACALSRGASSRRRGSRGEAARGRAVPSAMGAQAARRRPRGAACAIVGAGPLSNEVAGGAARQRRARGAVRHGERAAGDCAATMASRRSCACSTRAAARHADSARAATAELIAELQAWIADADLADTRYALVTSQAIATAPSGWCAGARAALGPGPHGA
jgi:hypothetical protein